MKWIKRALIPVFLAVLTTGGYGAVHFYTIGKANFNFTQNTGYEAGANDFSTHEAYTTFGAGYGLTIGSKAFFGLELHYNLSGKAILTDPSDNDTVSIDTYKYASGLLLIGFNIVRNPGIRFYIEGGGGIAYGIDIKTKTYISAQGFETIIEPPQKRSPFFGFGGLGIDLYFTHGIGMTVHARYRYLAADDPQSAVIALAGLVFSF